jgi:hypothetical protein
VRERGEEEGKRTLKKLLESCELMRDRKRRRYC